MIFLLLTFDPNQIFYQISPGFTNLKHVNTIVLWYKKVNVFVSWVQIAYYSNSVQSVMCVWHCTLQQITMTTIRPVNGL